MKQSGEKNKKFRAVHLLLILKDAFISWKSHNPWRLSAIIAYYAILSLPGLLVIILNILSYIWGAEAAEGRVYNEIAATMGPSTAAALEGIFKSTRTDDKSLIPMLIGIGALIFGATGVFFHLQISLNKIWEIDPDPKSSIVRYIIDRLRSFAFVLVVAFLLMISFVVSAALSALQDIIGGVFPDLYYHVARGLNIIISIGFVTLLFATIFKFLPDARIRWKSVWIGALLTAVLFTIGKELLAIYFGKANPASVYGAAGSIIILLLWVSYSSLILFFGAEFTRGYARWYGQGIQPEELAKSVPKTEGTEETGVQSHR